MTDGPDAPHTPARDTPDNDDLGPAEEIGGGYPEEGQVGTGGDDGAKQERREQPQRDEG